LTTLLSVVLHEKLNQELKINDGRTNKRKERVKKLMNKEKKENKRETCSSL